MSGKSIVGKTWISVGIQDDTARGLRTMEQNMRRRTAAMFPAGGGRGGGGGIGGFGVGHQAAFMIEDMAVVYAQTERIQHSIRAGANNLSMMAMMLGGTVGLYTGIGAILSLTILPLIGKWYVGTVDINKMLEAQNRLIERGRQIRERGIADREAAGDIGRIQSGEELAGRLEAIAFDKERGKSDLEALDKQLAQLQRDEQTWKAEQALSEGKSSAQRWSPSWINDRLYGWVRTTLETLDVIPDSTKNLGIVQDELAKTLAKRKAAEDKLAQLETDAARLHERQNQLAQAARAHQEVQDLFAGRDVIRELSGVADGLTGPNDLGGERRSIEFEREFNQNALLRAGRGGLEGLMGTHGLIELNDRLAELRLRMLTIGRPNLELPGSLQQGTLEAAQQAEMNRRQQHDPQVTELRKLQDEARGIRNKLDDFLDMLETP